MRGTILVWAGKAAEGLPWLEGALRFDHAHALTTENLCRAYYFLGRYGEAVDQVTVLSLEAPDVAPRR